MSSAPYVMRYVTLHCEFRPKSNNNEIVIRSCRLALPSLLQLRSIHSYIYLVPSILTMARLSILYRTISLLIFAILQTTTSSFVIQTKILKSSLRSHSTHCFMSTTGQKEIEVVDQPDQDFLEKKGVFSWPTWGCGVSKFPWSYGESESCYVLQGKVTVTPTDGRKPVTFGPGDFVTFPAGMSCTWDVTEAVQKHYNFF